MTNFSCKLLQYLFSITSALIAAFESTIDFFVPSLIAIVIDIISAYFLGQRVHKKNPDKADGKFKSGYKTRVIWTMIIVFLLLILAHYVDHKVRIEDDMLAQRFAMSGFLFYELWSCLENWSSENENVFARALQRIMVNKAERHLNVPLSDIFGTKTEHKHHHDEHHDVPHGDPNAHQDIDIEPIENEAL